MKLGPIESPLDLINALTRIFPDIDTEWVKEVSDDVSAHDQERCGYHSVFRALSSEAFGLLENGSPRQVKKFCDLINYCVDQGGLLENAVSTCLLEHAKQVGIRSTIKPYLSKAARNELR